MTDYPWLKTYPENLKWDMPIETRPVYSIFDDAVATFPDHLAFDFMGKKWTYRDLGVWADKFAAGLQSIGVKKGTHVGLFLPNCPYYVVAYYAIMKAGGVVVNYNPLYAEKSLEYQINDSDTDIMITLDLDMLYSKVKNCMGKTNLKKLVICPMTESLPFPKNFLFKIFKAKDLATIEDDDNHFYWDDLINTDHVLEEHTIDVDQDTAVIQYTGGTTGVPKGVELTHSNIYSNTIQASAWFTGVEPGKDKMLGVLPFFHVFAMIVVLNLSVKNGMEIIAMPRFELKDALKNIDKKKPTLFPAVPAIYSAIINCDSLSKYDLSSIRFCISGGAPLPKEVKIGFERLTGCKLAEGYGLTESSPVACCNPLDGENKTGSIGLPLPQTIVEIVNQENKKDLMPLGEAGELCIRGPQVMKGYYKNNEATQDTVRANGRLHTGDVAYIDEDGYVFIIDRIKDMIITNGYNVYPRYVEEAIYLHEDVEECIVGGLPDDRRGEIVKAWIKPKKGKSITAQQMKEFLQDKVSAYEMPKKFEFRNEPLPKTLIGKLSRKDVIAQETEKASKDA